MSRTRRVWLAAAMITMLQALAWPALAGPFPERPIRFVVPNTAGSATDQLARTVAASVQKTTGQPVVIDNKAGANGIIAADLVAKSSPDGYTVLIGNVTTNAANPHLYKKLPYDAEGDFVPLTGLGRGTQVLVVNNDLPVRTVAELIAKARAEPGKYAFGSGGASARVAAEAFSQMAGIKLLHVPYKGNPLALTDLMAGQIQLFFPDMTTALPLIRAGKVRALAVTSTARSTYLPDLPTLDEAGLRGYEAGYWFAAYAPAGTPADVVAALNRLLTEGVRSDGAEAFFKSVGMDPFATSAEEMRQFNRRELAQWGRAIKAAGIEPE
ncbi:MAG TPA: tripartite tricarboxylate transporter substrate binding protein [Burkholderiaceae bacterium]|nr:tripartite tricarboxylate transporter substrate binding protein [Burkholderiaceae bacterium]